MRHGILGVGGVGGLMGAALAHAGEEVTLVVRREVLADYPAELSLVSPFGTFSVPVKRVALLDDVVDVLWIAVKATQLEASVAAIDGSKVGMMVPLLNGVDHVAWLRERFGREKVVAGAIRVESERVEAGRIVHRSPFAKLSLGASGRERLQSSVDELREFGFQCEFVDDEQTLLWGKLVFLGPLALTTTASGMTRGEVAGDAEWRRRFEECAREACAVATACGAKVDMAGVISFFNSLPDGMRSSMQRDVAAGDEPELDAIAGPILRGGKRFGLDVSVTRELVERVVAMAGGANGIGLLKDLRVW